MTVYKVGPFHLRVERRTLTHSGKIVPIGPKVVETLVALVERDGRVASKAELMERVWPNRFVEEGNLAQNVYVLRKAFERYGLLDAIETIPGNGYRLMARACLISESPTLPLEWLKQGALRWASVGVAAVLLATASPFVAERSIKQPAESAGLSDEGARLYAIGRYYWNLRTSAGVEKSLSYFAKVVDRDPQSPLGYVGMADANVSMGDYCYGAHRPAVYFSRARAYAAKALVLDPRSAPAHATYGFVALHDGQKNRADSEFRRAIRIDPSYAPAHEWYGIALTREDRRREAWVQLNLASRLDPLSVATMAWLSRLAYRDRRFGQAFTYRKDALEMSPDLALHVNPPQHPTWASIEDSVY